MKALLALALAGCATANAAPWTNPSTPDHLKQAQTAVRAEMRYDYRSEVESGRNVWTGGCPSVGDCEDVALCLVEKLRQQGRSPQFYVMKWNSGRTPWTHIMVKDAGWYADYHGTVDNPDRLTATHECQQASVADGQQRWSSKGTWACKSLSGDGDHFVRVVE